MSHWDTNEKLNWKQWNNDMQWKIKRLKFLLSIREKNPKLYSQNRLGEEKEEFYFYESDVVKKAINS